MHWRYGEACKGSRGRGWRGVGGGWGSSSGALSSTCAGLLGLWTPAARHCREVQQFTMATIRNYRGTGYGDSHHRRWQRRCNTSYCQLSEISHSFRTVSLLHACDLIVHVWHMCVLCFQHGDTIYIYGGCVSVVCVYTAK